MSKQEDSESLSIKNKYTFNKNTKKFVFHTEEKFGSNLVFSESKINAILKLYSNFDRQPHTISEIERKLNVRKDVVAHILKLLNKTHDSLPLVEEAAEDESEETLVEDLVSSKEFAVQQKFEKADWRKTQEDADKWRALKNGNLDNVRAFLETLEIPVCKTEKKLIKKSGDVFVVGISDTHFGCQHFLENAFNGKEYKFEDIKHSFDKYLADIKQDVDNRKNKFESCYLLSAGDILHSLNSFTTKGTKLQDGVWGSTQFKLAFETLAYFINGLYKIFGDVKVKAVGGNHDFTGDYILFYTLEKYFSQNKNIEFEVATARWLDFSIKNNLFLMDHGASAEYKSVLPEGTKQREAYIQNLFMNINSSKYKKINNRYFVSGDRHNIQYGEYANFEFIRFSTPVKGDRYADGNNLKNRPRFNSLVVNEDGVKEILNYFV
jgi:hypothetical protein